jgi:alkyl hydroperoxide reductase subunit AhpC
MSRVLGIGEKFPEFAMEACVSLDKGKEFKTVSNKDMEGKWNVVFFWPLDFTFVCPTEISDFNKEYKNFRELGTQVFGVSCDSKFVHLAWRKDHPDLKALEFPMLADNKKDLSDSLGVLHPIDKIPLRATFVIDPKGTIRWVSVNDLSVGRNTKEVLRTVSALQTNQLTPCNWTPGQKTLS